MLRISIDFSINVLRTNADPLLIIVCIFMVNTSIVIITNTGIYEHNMLNTD